MDNMDVEEESGTEEESHKKEDEKWPKLRQCPLTKES
jgi:hypothetical protein